MSPRLKKLSQDDFTSSLNELDSLIKSGQASEARKILTSFQNLKIPRDLACRVASLARRAELPDIALKLLGPIVRSGKPLAKPVTDSEKAEYAANLVKIGATTEAFSLLKTIDREKCAAVCFFEAFAHISLWNYRGSIPLLETYLKHPLAEPYLTLVAKVNLASSLTFERHHDQALFVIERLIGEAKEKSLTLLHGNLLELRAQNAIFNKRWTEADESLEQANILLAATGARFGLFIKKWKTFSLILQNGLTNESLSQLQEIRTEASVQKHFETLRDCDRVLALTTHDFSLGSRLFFGTPFDSFRQRLRSDWGERFNLPEFFDWKLGPPGESLISLNLHTGEMKNAREPLKTGGILHRLLQVLSSDFYRPQRLACLYSALYPGEYFNASSASLKIHQAVNRLRAWIKKNRLPLVIVEATGFYSLDSTAPFSLRVSHPERLAANPLLEQLLIKWPENAWFSVKEAAGITKLSASSTLRLLNELRNEGSLLRQGSGKNIRYAVALNPTSKKKAA